MATIDAVTQGADGTVFLILRYEADGSMLDELQQLVHDAVGFALDGQLLRMYPTLTGKPVVIRIDVPHAPGPELAAYIEAVRPKVSGYGLGLIVGVVP